VVGNLPAIDLQFQAHIFSQSDSVASYIEWAHKEGFGVIDANIPKYITQPEDIQPFEPRASEKDLSGQILDLVYYIWDNYLQLYENADDIFLMGVGNAYLGVKLLLQGRSGFLTETLYQRP
jgi:histone deacetylase 6